MTVLVLDFDGTMTDAEAEGRPFRDGYLEDLCALVGRSPRDPEVEAIAVEVEAELAAAPASHPFLWMGRAVAPATVDPYLRMVPIAHRILDRFGALPGPTDRGRLLGNVLYRYNYAKTLGHPVFRAGAGDVLRALGGTEAWIVTNSDTHAVAGKVAALDHDAPGVAWLTSRVRGHARKFDVDDRWNGDRGRARDPGARPAGAAAAARLPRHHPVDPRQPPARRSPTSSWSATSSSSISRCRSRSARGSAWSPPSARRRTSGPTSRRTRGRG